MTYMEYVTFSLEMWTVRNELHAEGITHWRADYLWYAYDDEPTARDLEYD